MGNYSYEDGLLKIGEVSEKAGLPIPTIRHYTSLGLLKASAFTDGGQCLYDDKETIEELKYIKGLSGRGMKLNEICDKKYGKNPSKKVIIVDDDVQVPKMLKKVILRAFPTWDINISTNVFDAGHMLIDFLPDLVLLDICLPAVEGYEVCKFIKSNILLKYTKIIVMTGYDAEKVREKVMCSGADTLISKPLDIEDLVNSIKKVFSM